MSYNPPPPPPGGGSYPPPPGGGDYGGYPPPPPGYGYGGPAVPRTNQKALWSMILGIVGFLCCGLLLGPVAIVLGSSARKEIAASGGAQSGDGMAKAGVILGAVALVLNLLSLVLFATGALDFTPTFDGQPGTPFQD